MRRRLLLYLLAIAALSPAAAQRKTTVRVSGGQRRLFDPDPDDSELMNLEATGDKKREKPDQEEKVKTLSQQVADGKYGLIQKELFSKPPKRPGVLSYEPNPEVPNDTINNLGGLDKNEIWLAENHLLILSGGNYPPHDDSKYPSDPIWTPIDNYKAPLHQVKIPAHPKVPPPFPVQFSEDGPLQILGTNSSRTLNETDQSSPYTVSAQEGFPSPIYPTFDTNSSDATPWQSPLPIPVNPSGEYNPGVSLPPSALNETWPPYFGYLPPGAVILPPPGNQTDLYDDDDPSIYYPPPYSFYYPTDNSSTGGVPAGPLVPGIILPPPPNFFTLLDETSTATVPVKPQRYRKPPLTTTTTTTPLPQTVKTKATTTEKPVKIYPVEEHHYLNEVEQTTLPPKIITVLPVRQQGRTYLPPNTQKPSLPRRRPQNITILRPIQPSTTPTKVYAPNTEIPRRPFEQYGPPVSNRRPVITTTQVPLKYYSTSNDIDSNSVSQLPQKYATKNKPTAPAEYFYYEEPETTIVTTKRPPVRGKPYTTEEYFVPLKPTPPPTVRPKRPQYVYVTARPYNTQRPRFRLIQQPVKQDSFSIHIAKLQKQIHEYYTTPKPAYQSKPVYQYSYQAANYKPRENSFNPSPPEIGQTDHFRPSPPKYNVQIQQAVEIFPTEPPGPIYYEQNTEKYRTTRKPYYQPEQVTTKNNYLPNVGTSKPITQYSFEATPNPLYQGFYTKPDEGFFDENTKQYFTMFGRKLPTTTPIPEHQNLNQDYVDYNQPKPISLEDDTRVNYLNPRPTIDPDAELIPNQPRYPNPGQGQRGESPEIVKAIPIEIPQEGPDGAFISYQLPGDNGAHFYFLTPQLAQRRDQGSGFYYSRRGSRVRRYDKKSDKDR